MREWRGERDRSAHWTLVVMWSLLIACFASRDMLATVVFVELARQSLERDHVRSVEEILRFGVGVVVVVVKMIGDTGEKAAHSRCRCAADGNIGSARD